MTDSPEPPASTTPRAALEAAAELHRALSHGTRLGLLQVLGNREASVGELGSILGVSQPATSQHLAVLRAARLVRRRREGHRVLYCLATPEVLPLVIVAVDLAARGPMTAQPMTAPQRTK